MIEHDAEARRRQGGRAGDQHRLAVGDAVEGVGCDTEVAANSQVGGCRAAEHDFLKRVVDVEVATHVAADGERC